MRDQSESITGSLVHMLMTAVQAEHIKTSADIVLNGKFVVMLNKICCLISIHQDYSKEAFILIVWSEFGQELLQGIKPKAICKRWCEFCCNGTVQRYP